ncbi:hypothetical protein H1S01_13660 [Heliobacterium chlorum]|uniref:Uncharacterized protein n=1 Tax=Heliobacterium chlorum TaxID=2698 RepID=A0ABR7T5N6_HELCL|nr:hypothetical protein [Heliobacterium chlorum]MBC9785547.1 hypothetical protein [Heliobacterium chlorum]
MEMGDNKVDKRRKVDKPDKEVERTAGNKEIWAVFLQKNDINVRSHVQT